MQMYAMCQASSSTHAAASVQSALLFKMLFNEFTSAYHFVVDVVFFEYYL